jgi:hypothetical protein
MCRLSASGPERPSRHSKETAGDRVNALLTQQIADGFVPVVGVMLVTSQ